MDQLIKITDEIEDINIIQLNGNLVSYNDFGINIIFLNSNTRFDRLIG